MALVTISKIPCAEFGSTREYDLDTNLFNTTIFKMCTECGVFAHDFAEISCDRGHKLDYVDVSDIDALRCWLNNLALNDSKESEEIVSESTGSDSESDVNTDFDLRTDNHQCDRDADDCTNEDCLDCTARLWEVSSVDGYDDGYDAEYYRTYHECGSECESECGQNAFDETQFWTFTDSCRNQDLDDSSVS